MQIQTFLQLYAISVPIFFLIDLFWLGIVAKSFYRDRIGHLMEIQWLPAIIFYLLFLLGLTFFATYPTVNETWKLALIYGALFGFFTYATYDLTNLATLRGWPLDLVIVDIVWGTCLGGFVALVTHYLYHFFG